MSRLIHAAAVTRLLLVLTLALASCQSDPSLDTATSEAPQVAYADIEPAQQEVSGSSVPPPSPPPPATGTPAVGAPASTPAPRALIRTADLRLRVSDYDEARRAVAATARRMNAVVAGEAEQRLAYEVSNTITIRVAADRFDPLMEALAGLGEVVERRVAVEDVSEQAVDLEARLRARRAVEARYEAILARAGSVEDVLAVEARLAETREAIEVADGQLRGLRDRVALSTVTLTISEESPTGLTDGPGFLSRLGGAFGEGWDVFLSLVVGLVGLWPLVTLVPLGVWLWRRFQRPGARRAAASHEVPPEA